MGNLFLKLLNMSITAGWLILAVILLRLLFRKAPKWISCLLWALVALRLICPVSLESIFSLIPSGETIQHDTVVSANPSINSGVGLVDNVVNPVLRESFRPQSVAGVNPLQVWLFAAEIIWAAGVCVMLLYALVSYVRLRIRVRAAVRLYDSVFLCEFIDTPFILGVVRPRIYIPYGMGEELREPVLAHEKAHLKRGDYFWKVLGYILLSVYWFHPLCWAAYVLFCKDIELACDERVIRNYDFHQKKMYAEALLECSVKRHSVAVCPLAFGEVGVKARIKSVLHYKKPSFWVITAAVLACAAAAVCFLTDPVENIADTEEETLTDNGGGEAQSEENGVPENGGLEREADLSVESVREVIGQWTKAFVGRNGNTIAALATDELIEKLEERELLSGSEGQRSFGLSSPWPIYEETDVFVYSFDENEAQIYYYAWTSDPHVTVWSEKLYYELREGSYVFTGEELFWFDDISSAEMFAEAYGSSIDGSIMDYESNGAGEILNQNALLSSSDLYRDLFEPESAALNLLNLSDDPAAVKIERIFDEGSHVVLLITFLNDNESVSIGMMQPYGEYGIWIPTNGKAEEVLK